MIELKINTIQRREEFAYCAKRLKNGYWIFLNRNYKPLGTPVRDQTWVDYDKHPSKFKLSKAFPEEFIFFYDEKSIPKNTGTKKYLRYLDKIEEFESLIIQ